jgi:rhodanese-related sulfurtransferase
MSKSIMDLVAEAKAVVPAISPDEAATMMDRENVVIVDVRDDAEVAASGKVKGALHVPRGMLEFRADETTPYHDEALSKDKTVILYCGSGGRAALGGKALLDLGYRDVRNLGAFNDWVESGGATEE